MEAKDEIHKQRTEAEKEVKERRNEVQRLERRIQQKEESIDRKMDNLEKKEETLQNKIKEAEGRLKEANEIKASQFEALEKSPATPQSRQRNTCFPIWRTSWYTKRRLKSTSMNRSSRMNPTRKQEKSSQLLSRNVRPIMWVK